MSRLAQVEIVFDDGRRLSFETTNKSSDGRAENGLVKLTRKARWEGDTLLTEIDIENGPEFTQRYELIAGGAQLRVSTTAEGAPGSDDDGREPSRTCTSGPRRIDAQPAGRAVCARLDSRAG